MPTRLIFESICTSESIARCSSKAQDAFLRLILYADNFGVFQVNLDVIKGRLWPLRKDVTTKIILNWLKEYEQEGMIESFDQDGKRYTFFVNWAKFQRIRPGLRRKFPAPPAENSGNPLQSAAPGGKPPVSGAVAGTDTKAVAVRPPVENSRRAKGLPPLSPQRGDVKSNMKTIGQVLKNAQSGWLPKTILKTF